MRAGYNVYIQGEHVVLSGLGVISGRDEPVRLMLSIPLYQAENIGDEIITLARQLEEIIAARTPTVKIQKLDEL